MCMRVEASRTVVVGGQQDLARSIRVVRWVTGAIRSSLGIAARIATRFSDSEPRHPHRSSCHLSVAEDQEKADKDQSMQELRSKRVEHISEEGEQAPYGTDSRTERLSLVDCLHVVGSPMPG
ncbi:hypothetical protein N7519_007935 [Penicillium mononematosum]|uniref:uncharacterized protein n=1 Tax=Penicillium mononematosum TaxID=268346 RepID=UPI0025498465|nr:uncharacterized protein N7519_007935 [Penicillium mononematosum]KAJ6186634.1 hypothetical protein N7519_007935 [Penicillium mononematosum]